MYFWCHQIPQKNRTKTSRPEVCVIVVKSNLFVRFSEELRMLKSPFEIKLTFSLYWYPCTYIFYFPQIINKYIAKKLKSVIHNYYLPKSERRPQITKLMGHDSSNDKSRFYSKFEYKNSQKMWNKHLHMTVRSWILSPTADLYFNWRGAVCWKQNNRNRTEVRTWVSTGTEEKYGKVLLEGKPEK